MDDYGFIPNISSIISKEKAAWLNPLTLAFIGDSVQTLFLRTKYAVTEDATPKKLHIAVAKEINATEQARQAHDLLPLFTEEELAVFKRARNHTSHSAPKHSDSVDYRLASGLEAVFGYLYLIGENERLKELLEK